MKIWEVKEHEEIDPFHFQNLLQQIKSDGILKRPIVIDKKTKVILDGVHRTNILKELGCDKIPAILVDYSSPKIKVLCWRKEEKLTKKDVILAGLTGKKFPPKTSKHMIEVDGKLKHISFIQKRIDIPLEELRSVKTKRRKFIN